MIENLVLLINDVENWIEKTAKKGRKIINVISEQFE
jgi:hypothetical protein